MNKTIKYILIGIAAFFGTMVIIMLFMGWFGSKDMQNEMKNEINQNIGAQAVNTISRYQDISTKEFASMLKNKDFTLVNVHIPYIGDIEGTDTSYPLMKYLII